MHSKIVYNRKTFRQPKKMRVPKNLEPKDNKANLIVLSLTDNVLEDWNFTHILWIFTMRQEKFKMLESIEEF